MYILFDIGGTKTRLAKSYDLKTFEEPVVFKTPALFDEGMRVIVEAMKGLVGDSKPKAIVGGMPGPLLPDKSGVSSSANLQDWSNKSVVGAISAVISSDVTLVNDADLAGLGEMHFGSGETDGVAAYLTISTGLGGGRYVDGVLDISTYGFEPGYQVIDLGGETSSEHTTSSQKYAMPIWQDMISGTAFKKRYGVLAYEVTDPMAWDEAARNLAVGLSNITVLWSPKVVVLGGSMITGDPAIDIALVQKYFNETPANLMRPELRKAKLGDLGGLYGAMALLKQKQEPKQKQEGEI